MDERINYYGIIERKGFDILEKGYMPKMRPIERLFQIMRMEAFEPYESWEVFSHKNGNNGDVYIAVLTVWDREGDLKLVNDAAEQLKLRNNKSALPTIKRKQAVLKPGEISKILSDLSSMQLCPIPKASQYTIADGTIYSMKLGDWQYNCCFRWTCSGPDNWNELRKTADKTIEIISSSIENDGEEIKM